LHRLEGTIYRSTGSWYDVKCGDEFWNARLKGKFKLSKLRSSNPLAVGDQVLMDIDEEHEKTAIIHTIKERNNHVLRESPQNRHKSHIIAANLDQSLLIASLKDPITSSGFIDRFLVSCEAYHIPAIVVFNKIDLYKSKEKERMHFLTSIYEDIGYSVIHLSAATSEKMDRVESMLQKKTTLLSGHSGVGKSSIINLLFPDRHLKTQEVSEWSGKGLHTTTFAQMFDLNENSRVIDTPGIRELGLVDMSAQELGGYFPEIKPFASECKFNDCLHLNEPSCAVHQAVVSGQVSGERFENYMSMLATI